MSQIAQLRLRTLGWFFLLPFTLLGLVPWWLHRHLQGPFVWQGSAGQWVGAWLLVNGAGLTIWCVNLLNVQGRGTPMPLDPPTQFVVCGPYRVVRNPMALGLFLVLGAQALLYASWTVFLYLLLLIGTIHWHVCRIEEPELERRFGQPYLRYKHDVPRWFPRSSCCQKPGSRSCDCQC